MKNRDGNNCSTLPSNLNILLKITLKVKIYGRESWLCVKKVSKFNLIFQQN